MTVIIVPTLMIPYPCFPLPVKCFLQLHYFLVLSHLTNLLYIRSIFLLYFWSLWSSPQHLWNEVQTALGSNHSTYPIFKSCFYLPPCIACSGQKVHHSSCLSAFTIPPYISLLLLTAGLISHLKLYLEWHPFMKSLQTSLPFELYVVTDVSSDITDCL